MKQKASTPQRSTLVKQPWLARAWSQSRGGRSLAGFTLLELVITVTVLSILTLGAVPLVKVSVQRQKEQQLRDTLREMRIAIDQFHREAVAAPLTAQQPPPGQNQQANPNQNPQALDPRVRVYISDQTIFTVDNSDRYPPNLEVMVDGVDVMPFASGLMGGRGDLRVNATDVGSAQQTAKKKHYLRSIPIDPITGKAEWEFRSCYQAVDDTSWDNVNVFDVRSKATGTALNGEKYSDW
ncbi:MAG: ral secretion pathway protein [Blastocatellia bacterium]|nr:ral secretion pathway protein [Blastocatellia bacterium]